MFKFTITIAKSKIANNISMGLKESLPWKTERGRVKRKRYKMFSTEDGSRDILLVLLKGKDKCA